MSLELDIWPVDAVHRFCLIARSLADVSGGAAGPVRRELRRLASELDLAGWPEDEVASFVDMVLRTACEKLGITLNDEEALPVKASPSVTPATPEQSLAKNQDAVTVGPKPTQSGNDRRARNLVSEIEWKDSSAAEPRGGLEQPENLAQSALQQRRGTDRPVRRELNDSSNAPLGQIAIALVTEIKDMSPGSTATILSGRRILLKCTRQRGGRFVFETNQLEPREQVLGLDQLQWMGSLIIDTLRRSVQKRELPHLRVERSA